MILVIVSVILSLDQLSKFLVSRFLQLNQSVPVISGIFDLTLVHNRGAAFGIFRNQVPVFIITAIIAVAMIFFTLRNKKHKALFVFALSLILAGALGNLIDRVRFGYVIDFLDFRVWPVFNVADSAITIGAVILAWSILTERHVS
jgi:signal peptidase II